MTNTATPTPPTAPTPALLTLAQMQQTPAATLLQISLTAPCRFYATAASQMAAAMAAYKVGDQLLTRAHVERAKTAYLRCLEVEADRVKRTGRDIVSRADTF